MRESLQSMLGGVDREKGFMRRKGHSAGLYGGTWSPSKEFRNTEKKAPGSISTGGRNPPPRQRSTGCLLAEATADAGSLCAL